MLYAPLPLVTPAPVQAPLSVFQADTLAPATGSQVARVVTVPDRTGLPMAMFWMVTLTVPVAVPAVAVADVVGERVGPEVVGTRGVCRACRREDGRAVGRVADGGDHEGLARVGQDRVVGQDVDRVGRAVLGGRGRVLTAVGGSLTALTVIEIVAAADVRLLSLAVTGSCRDSRSSCPGCR